MWEYRTVKVEGWPLEEAANEELAKWAAAGWELVNGTHAMAMGSTPEMWLFWQRPK